MKFRVDLRGQAADAVRRAATVALSDASGFLLEEANRTVPIEEGTLARSGVSSVDGLRAAVSYDTPYSVRQHEDTRLRHDSGRRAKWLEHTFREQSPTVGQFIARKMREVL